MENDWLCFKHDHSGVNMCMNHNQIQDYCNLFTIYKCVCKKNLRAEFWLQMMNYFYFERLVTYMAITNMDDKWLPNIQYMNEAIEKVKNKQY